MVKAERDKLIGDINYLKKKLQSVLLENEKMLRAMQRQGLEVSQESIEGGGSFEGRHR